jgi:hypothetical protein
MRESSATNAVSYTTPRDMIRQNASVALHCQLIALVLPLGNGTTRTGVRDFTRRSPLEAAPTPSLRPVSPCAIAASYGHVGHKWPFNPNVALCCNINELGGGEGGIRTPGTVTRTPHFECGAIDHSATSPHAGCTRGSLGGLDSGERAPCQPPFETFGPRRLT